MKKLRHTQNGYQKTFNIRFYFKKQLNTRIYPVSAQGTYQTYMKRTQKTFRLRTTTCRLQSILY